MAKKDDFTQDEWTKLEQGVMGATMLVATADPGFFDTFKETRAMAMHVADARTSASSELIKELAHESRLSGFGLVKSPQELEQDTVGALSSAVSTLNAKAPDEVDAYRQFVLEIAQSVANAAGGVATSESGAIAKIKAALDAT
jgi:phospholipase/lecithinase/hemolysin